MVVGVVEPVSAQLKRRSSKHSLECFFFTTRTLRRLWGGIAPQEYVFLVSTFGAAIGVDGHLFVSSLSFMGYQTS